MPMDDHLRAEQYVETREGRQRPTTLALRLHDHLVGVCPECRAAWEQLDGDQDRVRTLLRDAAEPHAGGPGGGGEPPSPDDGSGDAPFPDLSDDEPDHHLPAFLDEADALRDEITELRRLRRKIRKEAWELERQTPEERLVTVGKARRRFRSPALAEHLIEVVRERVRSDPRDAESLASLIPHMLHWTPDGTDLSWITELVHRANAWRANALRVAGDLPAADRAFAALRRDMAREPVEDVRVIAEASAMEASLRLDQRRFKEARALLDKAMLLYRDAGDSLGVGRTLIQQAGIEEGNGRAEEALRQLAEAMDFLSQDDAAPYDRLCAVNGRVNLLINLERLHEAAAVLDDHVDIYETSTELHVGPFLRGLRGRIALGLGNPDAACEEFTAAVEGLLALDRSYDAALASLDLAQAFFDLGRTAELKPLARRLITLFGAREVEREAMASLQLLGRAITSERLTADLLVECRQQLQKRSSVNPY